MTLSCITLVLGYLVLFIAPKDFKIIWFSNLSTLSVKVIPETHSAH